MSLTEPISNTGLSKGLKLCLISLLLMFILQFSHLFVDQLMVLFDLGLSQVINWASIASVVLLFLGVRRTECDIENKGLRMLARWIVYGLGVALAMRGVAMLLINLDKYDVFSTPFSMFRWINYTLLEHIMLFLYFVLLVGLGSQIRMVQFRFLSMKVLRVIFMYLAWIGFESYHTVLFNMRGANAINIYSSPLAIGVYLFIYFVLIVYTFMILRAAKKMETATAIGSTAVAV